MTQLAIEFEKIASDKLTMSFTESAKVLGLAPKREWIHFLEKEIKAVYRTGPDIIVPYQKELDAGRFEVIRVKARSSEINVTQTRITQSGLEFYKNKYVELKRQFRIGETVVVDGSSQPCCVIENDKKNHVRVWYIRKDTGLPHASLVERIRVTKFTVKWPTKRKLKVCTE